MILIVLLQRLYLRRYTDLRHYVIWRSPHTYIAYCMRLYVYYVCTNSTVRSVNRTRIASDLLTSPIRWIASREHVVYYVSNRRKLLRFPSISMEIPTRNISYTASKIVRILKTMAYLLVPYVYITRTPYAYRIRYVQTVEESYTAR